MAPHSIWKQAQHHLQYCLLKGSQREGRHLSGPSPISRPEWCCWSQIVLGFGFSPVVNLILQPVLIPRINSLWSSPSKHFFFSPWIFSSFILFGEIYVFWLMLPKSFSFSPDLQGAWILASSSKDTWNLDFLVESWQFTGQESWGFFVSHTL